MFCIPYLINSYAKVYRFRVRYNTKNWVNCQANSYRYITKQAKPYDET